MSLSLIPDGTKNGSSTTTTAFSKEQLAVVGKVAMPDAVTWALAPEAYSNTEWLSASKPFSWRVPVAVIFEGLPKNCCDIAIG